MTVGIVADLAPFTPITPFGIGGVDGPGELASCSARTVSGYIIPHKGEIPRSAGLFSEGGFQEPPHLLGHEFVALLRQVNTVHRRPVGGGDPPQSRSHVLGTDLTKVTGPQGSFFLSECCCSNHFQPRSRCI